MARRPLPNAYLNGQFIRPEDATVSAFDRGFLFGDGVYEVVPVYGGRLFHADLHLERLEQSLAGIGLKTSWNQEWWLSRMENIVHRNGGGDQSLYLQITRGAELGRDHRFPESVEPTVFMFTTETPPRDYTVDRTGLKAIIAEDFRWDRCHWKVTSLLANVLLRQQAADKGADEVILHRGGRLTEASISNLYIVRNGRVVTPHLSNELLPGVTRIVVLRLCESLGIHVDEMDVSTSDLDMADEVIISSSSKEIAPITWIDGNPVGTGESGPVYTTLRKAFDELITTWRS